MQTGRVRLPDWMNRPYSGREIFRFGCVFVPVIILVIVIADALIGPGGSLVGVTGEFDLDPAALYAKRHGALIIAMCAALFAYTVEPTPGSGDEPVTRKEYLQGVGQLQRQDQQTGQTVASLQQEAQRLRTELNQARSVRDLYLRSPMITGDDVERLQKTLVDKGYGDLLGETGIDSMFGQATDAAVRKFQADNNLPVTGCVTITEWELLNQ